MTLIEILWVNGYYSKVELISQTWHLNPLPQHPNGLVFTLFNEEGDIVATNQYFSVGGGFVVSTKCSQLLLRARSIRILKRLRTCTTKTSIRLLRALRVGTSHTVQTAGLLHLQLCQRSPLPPQAMKRSRQLILPKRSRHDSLPTSLTPPHRSIDYACRKTSVSLSWCGRTSWLSGLPKRSARAY